MLILVTPASRRMRRTEGTTFSGCSSTPTPSVMIKCASMASITSFSRPAASAGVPPPK